MTFSRSAIAILVRHLRQKYFGLLAATYILWPQEQCARPLNRCTGGLPGFFHDFNRTAMIWFTLFHKSSDTMGGHSARPHSLSGFSSVRHVPIIRMVLNTYTPLALDSFKMRSIEVSRQMFPLRVR